MKKIKHLIEYIAVLSLFQLLRFIPYKTRLRIGKGLGLLIFYIYKRRREIALKNIALSFQEKCNEQHVQICKDSFENVGKSAMEFIQLSGSGFSRKFVEKYISIEGEEYVKKALEKGRGVIALSPHIGNWEYVAAITASMGYRLSVIAKRQSNSFVNQFIERTRSKFNMEIIYKTGAGLPVMRALKDNRIVGFVADQDAGRKGTFVNFLGRPASTAMGPARFAVSCESPVLLFLGIRDKDSKMRIIFDEVSFNVKSVKGENRDDSVKNITQLWTEAIEKYVREYPGQYFWVHNRWKTKEKE